jgi:hypothetical protein
MTLPPPLERHVYVVRSEFADDALEAEWNRWYDEVHVPELLSVPGFHSATRFQERGAPRRYLALYEVDGPEVFETERYREISGWGEWAPHIVEWTRALYRYEPL